MEATAIDDLTVLFRACVSEMDVREARLIEQCFLADPRTPLRQFAKTNGLTGKQLGELRTRAMAQLREELAKRNVESIGDVL